MPTRGGAIQEAKLSGLAHRLHQRGDEIAVRRRRQPLALVALPRGVIEQLAAGRRLDVAELADLAVEGDVRQLELEAHADAVDDLVPAVEAALAVGGVVVAQPHVDRGERRLVHALDLAVDQLEHRIGRLSSRWSSSILVSWKRPLSEALKALAALVETSEPNRSSDSE